MNKNVSRCLKQHRPISRPADGLFSQQHWFEAFKLRNFEGLSIEFIRCLQFYSNKMNYNLEADERYTINFFVENFLFFFCHNNFIIPEKHLEVYVHLQPIITNVVAISDFETTTPWVIRLVSKRENYFKVLALLNPRTCFEIDQNLLFDISDYFASQWWSFYWVSVISYCRKETWLRIRNHLHSINEQFLLFNTNANACYFPATYVSPESDTVVKSKLNELAKKSLSNVEIHSTPDKRKLAIITGRWYRSAVYTSLAPMIHSLRGHYDLTLVHLGPERDDIKDPDLFEKVLHVQMIKDQMDLSCLHNNYFNAAIYPDIGMSSESIFLSNIRIAPIQIVMYGHPASTHGSCIDYFIGGKRTEDLSRALINYSERLVLVPGLGVYPVFPDFTPQELEQSPDISEPFLINCPWTSQKITWPLIDTLINILRKTKRKIMFQFFSGGGLIGNNAFIPFAKDIWSLLGKENAKLFPPIQYEMYLSEMQKGMFSMDSYPFGGFNTIIDSLHLKKPVITWKGNYAYNRFASATLDIIGLEELIAHSKEEYIDLALRMIENDSFRGSVTRKITSIDLKKKITESENPEFFRKAIDYLIENHSHLKNDPDRFPIIIE